MLMQELSCFLAVLPAHPVLPGCRPPFLSSCRPILSREGAAHSTLLVEKERTLFPIMLACYPKQTASTVGSTFLWWSASHHSTARFPPSAAVRHDRAAVPSLRGHSRHFYPSATGTYQPPAYGLLRITHFHVRIEAHGNWNNFLKYSPLRCL